MAAQGSAQGGESAHRFYISSPFLGLQKERERAKQLITRQNHAYGDSYGGSPEPLVESCQRDVCASDHYILILGERYGTCRPEHGGKSITELEFEAAVEAGLSLHAFFLGFVSDVRQGIELDPDARAALAAFRRRVSDRCVPVDCSDQEDGRSGWDVFAERITALAANPPDKPNGAATSQAARARTYSSADLEAWVERHQGQLTDAFLGLPSVQNRQVHVPLDVCLTPAGALAAEGPRLLSPKDLEPLLAAGGSQVLLLSGDGGAGKTSLAFAIARWWLAGQPGEVVRLPVLIETALGQGESVADRVRSWLGSQLGGAGGGDELPPELIKALLAAKRLIPIVDHLSELTPAAREHLLAALPPGLVVVTSRSDDDGFKERPLSRIVPQRIAVERLQAFFLDYLRRKGQGDALSDDDLMPAQAQLKRIVGDKPITVLLAQMFIDDVIANREEGLLAGSVPELMLSYVRRLDTPADASLRRRAGLEISEALAQKALRVVALASHRQGPREQPLFQPLEFSDALARSALLAAKPLGLGLRDEQAEALLGYLIELRLLLQPGAAAGRLRFPLDPLADHLAAAEQFERLEEQALERGPEVWEEFAAALTPRPEAERERMRGFLLALRDGAMEAQGKRALAMPEEMPDRLAQLGFLDPKGERYRLALQRARKWMWELGVPVASERRDAISKLAAMAAAPEHSERRAARDVASRRLARVLAELLPDHQSERRVEQQEAAVVLGLIGTETGITALEGLARDGAQPPELRRAALEALGLAALELPVGEGSALRGRVERFLEEQLRADALNLLVEGEAGWAEHDRRLPVLQGASRGLQLAAKAYLPLLGSGPGRGVPMLTLTALQEGEGLRIRTEVVTPPVWRLPLPQWAGEAPQQLELVVVLGGEAQIGSPETEEGRDWYANQRDGCKVPQTQRPLNVEAERPVRLARFAMVRHPITQAQWRAVAKLPRRERDLSLIPGTYKPDDLWERFAQPGGLPVDSVSWLDCREWLQRLNQWLHNAWPSLGGQGEAPQLALPSEGQWEAACRAGAATPFHFGDVLDASWANFDGGYTYGPGRKGDYRQRPVPVGFFGLVNRWGLAELHGQLFEWCGDQWHPDPTGEGWPSDGQPWEGVDPALEALDTAQKDWRLLRGGSWFIDPLSCRAANRNSNHPANISTGNGVRPCCLLPPGSLLGFTATRKPDG
ncbi:SUMF1/EgtB/PvdO family nonheme iron enzyme [Cyanobium sp. FGCU-6]|jgi:formylglycine-generating enzyme required for sulfatase activity|nr:SUMF1/EgtB/PvdO family nonheme iron enzyme [Cyanobium sp. FGCU6]